MIEIYHKSNKSIEDLTGIQDFTALEILDCSLNQLDSLRFLPAGFPKRNQKVEIECLIGPGCTKLLEAFLYYINNR